MKVYTINKRTIIKFILILCSLTYGFVVTLQVQLLFALDSGDIHAYVSFFEDINMDNPANAYALIGDGLFRLGVTFVGSYFNVKPLTVLIGIAFTISSIIYYIYLEKIRSEKYLIYIFPLLILTFVSPVVINLFASGIRSGIAFTILLIGIVYTKGIIKYIIFGFSGLIHLSMMPIIFMYILFYTFSKIKIKSKFVIPFFLLILAAISIVLAAKILNFNTTKVNSSSYYNLLILYLGTLIIFTNKNTINNIYGFISIGLILVYFIGVIIDLSFSRYIGNSILFYLFFLINRGELKSIQTFTTGFIPFVVFSLSYTLVNF
jgi:hypothetical protein